MQDRRTFLATLGALTAGCAAGAFRLPARAHALGIQLYTVRTLLSRDFDGTLAQLAAIGYREVELAGHHGRTAVDVRRALDRSALAAPSAHVPIDDLRDDWPRIRAEAEILGHRWVTVPWVQSRTWTLADWQRLAALLQERGTDAMRHGLRVAYHNHDFELRRDRTTGRLPLDVLFAETDPAVVDFELDVYWLVRAGQDPVAWLRRHPGRVRMLHLKDTAGAPEHRMVDVGAGTIDWPAVLAAGRDAGVQHLFVEHDQPADPIATARAAFAHLADLQQRTAP